MVFLRCCVSDTTMAIQFCSESKMAIESFSGENEQSAMLAIQTFSTLIIAIMAFLGCNCANTTIATLVFRGYNSGL